ncbi:MAG: hypothetical protein Tsb0014_10350 [Pleurocapsa sp.]
MLNTKNLSSLSFVGLLTAGFLTGVSSAQAAALTGGVSFRPGDDGGVILTGTGVTDPDGDPLTDFDFVPPVGGGTGVIVELNSGTPGPNDFEPFEGFSGAITDLTLAQTALISPDNPLVGFIDIANGFRFDLEQISFPDYSTTSVGSIITGTTVSIGVSGQFVNTSDGSNDVSRGVGSFSVDFAGQTPDQVRALFDQGGEVFGPNSYSATFVAFEQPIAVPESSNVVALLALGLGGATLIKRKNKLANN